MKIFVAILILLTVAAGVMLVLGRRWTRDTRALVTALRARPGPGEVRRFHAADLPDLPAPVRRYLLATIPEDQPILSGATVRQTGEFLINPKTGRWGPFRAVEHFATAPPGFVWDAHITMAPGITVRVRDGFVDQRGFMTAAVFGVVPVARVEGTPDIAAGALVRYLAEAVWLPTALLPSDNLVWTALSDSAARAHLSVGAVAVDLEFHFGPDGFVERIYAPARGRDAGGVSVPTPWQGRFRSYRRLAGMLVPTEGEVEWIVDGRPEPYWRGRILAVEP